ncbi:MAG: DNA-binding protein [Acidobacteria bacterium]|nr:MAG: DNA-binding protein [Acidobacteriota bacterium]
MKAPPPWNDSRRPRRSRRRRGAVGEQLSNRDIAERLRAAARLLRDQDANPFRVEAYRDAADTIESLRLSLAEIRRRGGVEALVDLPSIGTGIAAAIEEMLRTGRWSLLERLRGSHDPEDVLQRVPGIGPVLAERLHDELHIDTLEGLEMAAHDGRLELVEGVGKRRCAAIRASLAEILGRTSAPRQATLAPPEQTAHPDVAILLDVDAAYARDVAAGRLHKIAPRRFNPQQRAWLPVGHYRRGPWDFTALFSNTARAHELRRTHDWVILYYYDHDHREGQVTVVTETSGSLVGRRVVRGREVECRRHYEGAGS